MSQVRIGSQSSSILRRLITKRGANAKSSIASSGEVDRGESAWSRSYDVTYGGKEFGHLASTQRRGSM
jgi:hypothetical protein